MDKWLKQYKENYEGKSAEAKEIADYVKPTYNGAMYIPWATMERLTYMQDPNAEFKTILDEEFTGSKMVHTDSFINENVVEGKDGSRNASKALVVSHFVKVSCTFLGKTFIEEYPIQEQDYSAAKIYNQNLVNKALKRALAKVASRATGLGLKLYENKDLQFDEKEEEKKPEIKKISPKKVEKVEEVKKEEPVVKEMPVEEVKEEPKTKESSAYPKEIVDLCDLIKSSDKDKMTKVLQSVNTAILKKHGFALNLEDETDVLCEKISHFDNITSFSAALEKMLANMN